MINSIDRTKPTNEEAALADLLCEALRESAIQVSGTIPPQIMSEPGHHAPTGISGTFDLVQAAKAFLAKAA